MSYDAFFSYAHGAESELASQLQWGLQRFAKPWWRRRALRVFRDQSALSANPGLWSSIAEALDESDWLVLLASPRAAGSEWVNRELAHWIGQHGVAHLIIVVTAGDVRWDRSSGDFDSGSTAVPAALHDVYLEEPLHVDFRWASEQPSSLNLRNPRFRDQVAQIAAPIRGLNKDQIEGADLREHRRTRRTAIGAALVFAVLAALSGAAGLAATRAARRADQRTADADFSRLLAQARDLRSSDLPLAMLLAVESRRERDNVQSQAALLATLSEDPRFDGQIVDPGAGPGFTSVCLTDRGRLAVAASVHGEVAYYDVARRRRFVALIPFDSGRRRVTWVACNRSGSAVVSYDSLGSWAALDPNRAKVIGPLRHYPSLKSIVLSPDGSTVALTGSSTVAVAPTFGVGHLRSFAAGGATAVGFTRDGRILVTVNIGSIALWDVATLAPDGQISTSPIGTFAASPRTPLLDPAANGAYQADVSPDGRLLAVSAHSTLRLVDLSKRHVVWSRSTVWYGGSRVAFTDDGRLLASIAGGQIEQVDLTNGSSSVVQLTPKAGIFVNFSVSGTRLVATSDTSSVLSVFDLDGNGPITQAIPVPGRFQLAEFDPAGTSLLMYGSSPGLYLTYTRAWDATTGSIGPRLPPMIVPRFTGSHIVGGVETNFHIGYFDSRNAHLVREAPGINLTHATYAEVDPRTGRVAVTNSDGTVDLYDKVGHKIASPWLSRGGYPTLSSSGFASNGSIAMFDNTIGYVSVVDAAGHERLHQDSGASMASLSPDGRVLAVLRDVHLQLFDVVTGRRIGADVDVPSGTSDLEFSQDGSRLLAFSEREGVLIDVRSRQPLADPFASDGYLALRPDGAELATASDGVILLWDLKANDWTRAACLAAGRNLTQAEWVRYLPNAGPYRRTCSEWPAGS